MPQRSPLLPIGIVFAVGAVAMAVQFAWLYLNELAKMIRGAFTRGDSLRAQSLARRLLRYSRFCYRAVAFLGRAIPRRYAAECALFPSYCGWICTIATSFQQTGLPNQATDLLDRELERCREIGMESTEANARLLANRAWLPLFRAAFAEARPLLEKSLAIRKRLAGVAEDAPLSRMPFLKGPEIGSALSNLGTIYHALGDYPAAIRAEEDALTVYSLFVQHTPLQIGQSLVNLGAIYLEMEDLDRAGDVLRQAVRYMVTTFPRSANQHPVYKTAILDLAIWHQQRREFAEAIRLLRQCIDSAAATHDPHNATHILALNNLAFALWMTGDYEAARPLAEQAMAGRWAHGDDHPLVTTVLRTRAVIDVVEGKPRDALNRFREAAAIERRVLGRIFSVASDFQRLSYLAKVRKQLFFFLSLVHTHLPDDRGAVAEALDLVLTRKALAAEASAARRDAVLGGLYPELANRLHALSALRQQIAAKALAGPGPEGLDTHRRWLEEWQRQQEALEVELARAIPEFALERRLQTADRQAVAAALPAGSVLVEFVRFDLFDFRAVEARGENRWKPARYLAFVLQPTEPDTVGMIDLGECEAIDRRVREFRADLLGGEAGGSRGMVLFEDDAPATTEGSAAALSAAVFEPLRGTIAGAEHLVLAPDGELALVPFEVLPDPAGRPLIEAYRFSYLAVGRDILRARAEHGAAAAPLVIADPDFDLGSAEPVATKQRPEPAGLSRDLDRSSLRFPRLPGTLAEGRQVAAVLGVEPQLGPAAVEARLMGCASPRILHVATHGFFLPDQPDRPDGAGDAGGRLRGGAPENPLLRSGLALAGANTWLAGGALPASAGDGLLTAEDVTGLNLLNTELVVLSACETGLGQVRAGEGVFGLRRAFQLAGARAVVMSLWKVPDEATHELMVSFYRNLLAGVPRAEALRQAQLELKARYPSPRYWGAFILQGDPGPLAVSPT